MMESHVMRKSCAIGGSMMKYTRSKSTICDIDAKIPLIQLSSTFASQFLYCQKKLEIDPQKINVNGGAMAIGLPLGATGKRDHPVPALQAPQHMSNGRHIPSARFNGVTYQQPSMNQRTNSYPVHLFPQIRPVGPMTSSQNSQYSMADITRATSQSISTPGLCVKTWNCLI